MLIVVLNYDKKLDSFIVVGWPSILNSTTALLSVGVEPLLLHRGLSDRTV